LRAIASQLAGTIAHARLLIALHDTAGPRNDRKVTESVRFIRAESVVTGFALAPAVLLNPTDPLFADVPDTQFRSFLQDFRGAVQNTINQLQLLQDQLVRRLPESAALIFEAHYMILKDPRFSERIADLIQNGQPAAAAIRSVARHFMTLFENSANPYIREKSQDIEDLARRILMNLLIEKAAGSSPLDAHIVIASQLYPSDVLKLASESVAGIILVSGGGTSHVAILARSLKIPMIIANHPELLQVPQGTLVLMDADIGTVYVDPSEHILKQYSERDLARSKTAGNVSCMQPETVTADGTRVHLMANINLLNELELARELKAEGIGLYRSEFPFIVRSVFPSEEEQRVVYAHLFDRMQGRPVYIRTLDIGGDKVLPYSNSPAEANPELGLRSIRFSLKHRDIFDQQIRAILRAGAKAEFLGIMFPMISSVDELQTARQAVHDAVASLAGENLEHHPNPSIGTMIELPAVIDIMDELSAQADFFSIGTNDFIQYMLAVDRTNENVADYYQPFHPGILRGLARIVERAAYHGKPICVCGEVAHDPHFIPFLLGIGVRRLSVDPQFLPGVQESVLRLNLDRAVDYARNLLSCGTLAATAAIRAAWHE
jgi:phosphotransferase system, enzyme I, PtsP